jgi:putative ABC transport system substrate-binding protein
MESLRRAKPWRREFIAFVGCTAAAWSLAARAEQQSSMPVIGFLNSTSPQPFANYVSGFRVGLKQTGYIDGQNVTIEFRWAEGHYDRLSEMAADLCATKWRCWLRPAGRWRP